MGPHQPMQWARADGTWHDMSATRLQWGLCRSMAPAFKPTRAPEGNLTAVASLTIAPQSIVAAVAALLGETLALAPAVTASLTRETALFGNLPELDSMAVATVLTALEDRFHILIDDDEVSGAIFETVGALAAFVASKEGSGKAAQPPLRQGAEMTLKTPRENAG